MTNTTTFEEHSEKCICRVGPEGGHIHTCTHHAGTCAFCKSDSCPTWTFPAETKYEFHSSGKFVTVYKTWWGEYIDFGKLISVTSAYFIDCMGVGGWFVGFDLKFQDSSNPVHYERELVHNFTGHVSDGGESWFDHEQHHCHMLLMSDGSSIPAPDCRSLNKHSTSIRAVANLQKQIEGLIKDWETYKNV